MSTKLKKIFDNCDWKNKVEGSLPEDQDEILYIWREHEAGFAGCFFGEAGSKLLRDEDLMVTRTLHYMVDAKGRPTLAVRQVNKPINNMEEIAKAMADTMDLSKVQDSWDKACAGLLGAKCPS